MGWPVYLINLEKDRTRLEAATSELARAGITWTRVPAVNGRALPAEKIATVYDARENRRRARHPLTNAEIGCYLSHIAAWRRIAASGTPGGFVFEDDFRVTGDLGAAYRALCSDEGAWDMVKLFTFRPDARMNGHRQIAPGLWIAEPYKVPSTMLGYALRREAAQTLLKRTPRVFRPVDEDMKFFWEHGLKIATVMPSPIGIGNQASADGSVGDSRRAGEVRDNRGPLAVAFAGLRYQAGYSLRLFLRRGQG